MNQNNRPTGKYHVDTSVELLTCSEDFTSVSFYLLAYLLTFLLNVNIVLFRQYCIDVESEL